MLFRYSFDLHFPEASDVENLSIISWSFVFLLLRSVYLDDLFGFIGLLFLDN